MKRMNRRDLITRAGFLLGGLQVSEMFKLDLLGKLARLAIPEANAAPSGPKRLLEICLRDGIPMIQFGAGKELASLANAQYSNFPNNSSNTIQGTGTDNLFFGPNSAVLAPYAANIAITQSIAHDGSGHSPMFNIRQGSSALQLTTPIITLANANPTSSIIPGVQWAGSLSGSEPNGRVVNRTNGQRDLVSISPTNPATDYINLFKKTRLTITDPELTTVLTAANQLSSKQAQILNDKLSQASSSARSFASATQLYSTDFTSFLQAYTDLPSGMNGSQDMVKPAACCGQPQGTYRDEAASIGLAMLGFKHNLINSAMVTVDLGDWHPVQTSTYSDRMTATISRTLADVIPFLQNTPDLALPGLTLWDTTLIVVSSEFTRAVTEFGSDNADGGTQGIMLIGQNVRGNYYGSFNTKGSGPAQAQGFDNNTGAPTGSTLNSTGDAYRTVRRLLGLSSSVGEAVQAFATMVRSG